MRKLIKKIYLYDDNTFEEFIINNNHSNEITLKRKEDILDEVFSDIKSGKRIQINVAIYRLLKEYYNSDDTRLNDAVNNIAKYLKITRNAVIDKPLRQLGLTSIQYRTIIKDALNNDLNSFKVKLLNNLGAYTEEGDRALVEKYIK